jgi:hypothetical protein
MTKQMHTVPTKLEIDGVAGSDVDDTQKALVPSLELALIENLDGDDGGLGDITVAM